ncbi:hypothetical protein NQ315_013883 [Exocentrus adspersus]|uniref:Carboxylic ester hydrolase n=1 Tax=Exocentrus adspersus TaxID=1586481 RepID=A0AAV8VBA4_9CUCU|nr:hypothetical protein NQ315_013883 [Exocentrus adspersus]
MLVNSVWLVVVLFISSAWAQAGVTVTIANGQIQGRQESTYKGTTFYAFQEIPYAKPPVGNLRFMAPQPVEDWSGVLDATSNNKICYQTSDTTSFTQTEDCLYVNVYTPVAPGTNGSLPVMFYIFGGGFLNGHAVYQSYGPHLFMDQGVIVVTVNYRIGPFGFMSTGDSVIPGNMGLKDQQLALKWVQTNIGYFGGDPTKVTLFGLSAGAASVTLQMLGKGSEGLFRGAISESGSSLCPWAYQRGHKDIAYNMAAYLNPSFSKSSSSQELLTFLQSVTPDQVIASTRTFPGGLGRDQMVQGFMYAPVVEDEHEGAFLTQRQYDAVASGGTNPVPLLIGIMSEEQLSKAADRNSFANELSQYDQNPGALVNDNMHINDATKATAGDAIRKIYTSGTLASDIAAGVHYFSDVSFSLPIMHNARLHSAFKDVYFFQFSYHGDMVSWNNVFVEGCGKVQHAEDNSYLWNGNIEQYATAADVLTSKRYVKLFTNFAKNLNPTPEADDLFGVVWPTLASTGPFQYLDIAEDGSLQIKSDPKGEHYQQWVDLYESMAVKPYDTF